MHKISFKASHINKISKLKEGIGCGVTESKATCFRSVTVDGAVAECACVRTCVACV